AHLPYPTLFRSLLLLRLLALLLAPLLFAVERGEQLLRPALDVLLQHRRVGARIGAAAAEPAADLGEILVVGLEHGLPHEVAFVGEGLHERVHAACELLLLLAEAVEADAGRARPAVAVGALLHLHPAPGDRLLLVARR